MTGSDTVDRLPIVAKQIGSEQLLSVPKLTAGTGLATATAVFQTLTDWKLKDKIQAVCFDTGEYL